MVGTSFFQSSPGAAPTGQRRLACQHCPKSFLKKEHLQRHERTHSAQKLFSCPECGRLFSREDSVARHRTSQHGRRRSRRKSNALSSTDVPNADSSSQDGDRIVVSNALGDLELDTYPITTTHSAAIPIDAGASMLPSFDLPGFDQDFQWPDAEEFLQAITSSDWSSVALPPGADSFSPSILNPPSGVGTNTLAGTPESQSICLDGYQMAIHDLSQMITNSSSRVTVTAESSLTLTVTFLYECIDAYFNRVNPMFPILHRPTFTFAECSPSLLLNVIALGSLFIGAKDAISTGESLWRLAHTAVATSWPILIRHKGRFDSHRGVQLALTALLGQTYAMLSGNESIRLISQLFHSISFYWARHCGMFEFQSHPTPNMSKLSNSAADSSELDLKWKHWVAEELRLRALLGHYILDGQLAHYSVQPPCTIHPANPLPLSASSPLFEALTADEWLAVIRQGNLQDVCFREVYNAIFDFEGTDPELNGMPSKVKSFLDAMVILECLRTLVREARVSTFPQRIVAFPGALEVRKALLKAYDYIQTGWTESHSDRVQLTIMWHFVCFDNIIDFADFCNQICSLFSVEQKIFRGKNRPKQTEQQSPIEWARLSSGARRALLHAIAIHDCICQLPVGQAYSLWMPGPLFSAAIIYTIFALAGFSTISVPSQVSWSTALDIEGSRTVHYVHKDEAKKQTSEFLSCNPRIANYSRGSTRNLLYDLNLLRIVLQGLSTQWGLALEMEEVLQRLKAHWP